MRNALGFLRMSSFVDLSASDDESASGVSSHSSDGCRSVRTLRKRHVRALLGLREDVGRGSVQLSDHSPTRRERGSVSGSRREEASSDESGSHGRDASPAAPRQLRGDDRPDESELPADLPDGLVESKQEDRTFRFNARRVFLTYPQCGPRPQLGTEAPEAGLSAERIIEFLKSLGCTRWCIGRELHADGGLHFHVFAERRSRFDTENPRYFDIGPFHPNIASVKKLPGLLEYICKDGRYVLGGGLRLFERAATSGIDAPTSMLGQTSTDSCLSLIRAGQSLSLAVGCLARMVAPLNSDI